MQNLIENEISAFDFITNIEKTTGGVRVKKNLTVKKPVLQKYDERQANSNLKPSGQDKIIMKQLDKTIEANETVLRDMQILTERNEELRKLRGQIGAGSLGIETGDIELQNKYEPATPSEKDNETEFEADSVEWGLRA